MREIKTLTVYLSHGNKLVVSKMHVLLDSLIKFQNGLLAVDDVFTEMFLARFIPLNGQLCFNDYTIVLELINNSKCMTLNEYMAGVAIEYSCSKHGENATDYIDVLIQILSEFMDVTGVTAMPVWGLLDIFDDPETNDLMKVLRNLQRAYRRSTSPVCYIKLYSRLLPIYGVGHANQIADLYSRLEGTHCQSRLKLLLGDVDKA